MTKMKGIKRSRKASPLGFKTACLLELELLCAVGAPRDLLYLGDGGFWRRGQAVVSEGTIKERKEYSEEKKRIENRLG
jgi:hypothetical protein